MEIIFLAFCLYLIVMVEIQTGNAGRERWRVGGLGHATKDAFNHEDNSK